MKLKGNADLEVLRTYNCGTPCCRVLPNKLTGLVKKEKKKEAISVDSENIHSYIRENKKFIRNISP